MDKIAPTTPLPLLLLLAACTSSYPVLNLDDGLHLSAQNDEELSVPVPVEMTLHGDTPPPFTFALLTQNSHSQSDAQGKADYQQDDTLHRLLFHHPTCLEDAGGTLLPLDAQGNVLPRCYSRQHPDWKYNFYAYHAAGAADLSTLRATADNRLLVDLDIDGTQDIVHAWAMPTVDSLVQLTFSTQTARLGLRPQFNPLHLLSRFEFLVKGIPHTDELALPQPVVHALTIQSRHAATFLLADDAWNVDTYGEMLAAGGLLTWQDDLKAISAAEAANLSLNPEHPQSLGHPVLLPPSPAYHILLTVEFPYRTADGSLNSESEEIACDIQFAPDATTGKTPVFLPGHQYTVTITVYGKTAIECGVTLQPWVQGEDVNLDVKI